MKVTKKEIKVVRVTVDFSYDELQDLLPVIRYGLATEKCWTHQQRVNVEHIYNVLSKEIKDA